MENVFGLMGEWIGWQDEIWIWDGLLKRKRIYFYFSRVLDYFMRFLYKIGIYQCKV